MVEAQKITRGKGNDVSLPITEMLETTKAVNYNKDLIEKAHPTPSDWREVIGALFEPTKISRKWLRALARVEREERDIYDYPELMEDFRADAYEALQIWLARNPSLSQIGGAIPRHAQYGRTVARWSQVDDIFIRGAKPGGSAVIYGEMGSGKTDIAACEFYGPLLSTDWHITTNISIADKPEKAQFSSKLSGTLLHALENSIDAMDNKRPDLTAAILDEQQFSMPKERGSSNKNLFMKQMVLLSRKLKIWYVGIYQQKVPPTIIDEFARTWVHKPDVDRKDIAMLEIKPTGGISYYNTISEIVPAKDKGIEFETDSTYVYTPDINPLRMFDFQEQIAEMPVYQQKLKLIDYVKTHRGEKLDIISDDVKTKVLWDIRNRLKGSDDRIDRKVRTVKYLAHLVGVPPTTLQSRFNKLEEAIKNGLIIPEDPEDALRELDGAVGVSDDEETAEA